MVSSSQICDRVVKEVKIVEAAMTISPAIRKTRLMNVTAFFLMCTTAFVFCFCVSVEAGD